VVARRLHHFTAMLERLCQAGDFKELVLLADCLLLLARQLPPGAAACASECAQGLGEQQEPEVAHAPAAKALLELAVRCRGGGGDLQVGRAGGRGGSCRGAATAAACWPAGLSTTQRRPSRPAPLPPLTARPPASLALPQLLQQVAVDVQKAIGAADDTQYTASDAMAVITARNAPAAGAFVSCYCEEALAEMDRVGGGADALGGRMCRIGQVHSQAFSAGGSPRCAFMLVCAGGRATLHLRCAAAKASPSPG
jgi:hypothetical protein